ncbi:MAG TPA: hypothetical protein PLL20_19380 [Phycisphaerae bacterium]|nr:hypothetical protein [Phycisphaerae bacterium]
MTAKRKASGKRPAAKVARAVKRPRATGHRSRVANQIPAELGKGPKRGDVGYGKPPVEHQFAPGVSGNPAGTPPARANLWRHICKFLEAGEDEARRVQGDKSESLARRIAAKQALQLLKKGLVGVALQATMRMWDRDEGRPVAHVVMESPDVLTAEECEEIRQAMKIHHE